MKKSVILILVVFLSIQCQTSKTINSHNYDSTKVIGENYVKNSLIISYDETIGKKYLLEKIKEYNAAIKYDYKNINSIAITIPANKKLEDAEKFFKTVKGVILVNRDYINKMN